MLAEDERRMLENWVKRRRTAQGLAMRARIVLACAQGGSNLAVAVAIRASATPASSLLSHPDPAWVAGCGGRWARRWGTGPGRIRCPREEHGRAEWRTLKLTAAARGLPFPHAAQERYCGICMDLASGGRPG